MPELWRRVGSRVLGLAVSAYPPARRTSRQVLEHVLRWREQDDAVLAAGRRGRLWVVLGDSSAQGVGADSYDGGYVGQTRALLEARDGQVWDVVNLSVSGARTRDVVDDQLPRLRRVVDALGEPDLLTAVVGGNDATHTPQQQWLLDVEQLCRHLPRGAVVATVARGWHERKVRPVNARLFELAAEHGLRVADLWSHTGPPYRGRYADGFHPNERGYQSWTAALGEAIELPAASGEHDGRPPTGPAEP